MPKLLQKNMVASLFKGTSTLNKSFLINDKVAQHVYFKWFSIQQDLQNHGFLKEISQDTVTR